MKYEIQLNIGRDESRWTWEEFYKERDSFYQALTKRFASENARIDDLWVVFPNGTVELASTLAELCDSRGYNYDIGARPTYSSEEINQARFLPLLASSDCVDIDRDGFPLNEYERILCDVCGRVDDSCIPNPYCIDKKRMRRYQDIYYASQVTILSFKAFELLRDELEPWVEFGNVRVLNARAKDTQKRGGYFWIWPKYHIGPLANMLVRQRCEKCGEPTEVREEKFDDIFKRNLWIVESFCDTEAPIVRAGNWFGEITPQYPNDKHYYVFISPTLYEKMHRAKLKGFVEADYVIHAADEPYDWDPLGDTHFSNQSR